MWVTGQAHLPREVRMWWGAPGNPVRSLAGELTDVEPPSQRLLCLVQSQTRGSTGHVRSTGWVLGTSHGGAGRAEATRSQAQLFPIIVEGPAARGGDGVCSTCTARQQTTPSPEYSGFGDISALLAHQTHLHSGRTLSFKTPSNPVGHVFTPYVYGFGKPRLREGQPLATGHRASGAGLESELSLACFIPLSPLLSLPYSRYVLLMIVRAIHTRGRESGDPGKM